VDRQIQSLRKAGLKVTIFDVGLSYSPARLLKRWIVLRQEVRRLRPDLIHAQYGTIVGFMGALAGNGKPLVISFCGNDLLPGASVSRLRMYLGFLLSNLAALRARRIICKSEELRRALWWRQSRAVVIPNGIDLDMFSPGSKEGARKRLGWDSGRPIVLFNIGSDPQRKGLSIAEAAMKIVKSRLPDARLCVISNIEPDNMPLYYRAADVLLSASLAEGSPNVVKEALACNLPVVSTPVGDVAERLAGVQPSAIVAGDAVAMGEVLVRILLCRERSNGRRHVAHLNLDCVAQRVLQLYQSVLQVNQDPPPQPGDVAVVDPL
jgi:teichuronic acid biosynthesis glycosyltransferase TuaC